MNTRRGFTLIELTAVLVILALLSSVVGLSLTSVGRQTTLREAVSAVADLDRSMRVECVNYDRRGELRFDSESGRVVLGIERDGEAVDVQAYQLPMGMRLTSVQSLNSESVSQHGGSVVIPCDHRGQTPTYTFAIGVDGSRSHDHVLLVVAGLSGQVQEVQDESEIKNLFALLASGNTD